MKTRSRRLGSSAPNIAPNFTNYSLEGFLLSEVAHAGFRSGAFPAYFDSPDVFLEQLNIPSMFVHATKPVFIGNNALLDLDPLLMLKGIGVSLAHSNIVHRFPVIGDQMKNLAIQRLHSKLRASRQNVAALKSSLRDPNLLLYLLSNYYTDDLASFLSIVRFLFRPNNSRLEESSFVLSLEFLEETIRQRRLS